MRFSPGLLLLLPLMSPLAHAELIDDVFDRGELRIALEANTPPFNFKEGDKLTGFEVELGEQLAKEMDVRPSFITTDDTDLLPGVETGKYDVAINHIAMTAELQDRFDFSEAYNEKPALVIPFQKYIDEVFTEGHGSLYASDGRTRSDASQKYGSGGLIQGKQYMLSLTWNAPQQAFDDPSDFFEAKGVDAVYFPFHKANEFLGMTALPTFLCVDVMKRPAIDADVARYEQHLAQVFNLSV